MTSFFKANVPKSYRLQFSKKNDPGIALDWARSIDEVNQRGKRTSKKVSFKSIAEEDPSFSHGTCP